MRVEQRLELLRVLQELDGIGQLDALVDEHEHAIEEAASKLRGEIR